MSLKTLVVIPAYNEAQNIANVVKEVLALDFVVTPLVIDDGSLDATAEVARQAGAKVITLPLNLGIGGAVQTGYQYASANGFDVAVQVDGDGQHDVSFLKALITPIEEGRAEVVIGSRFLPPHLGYQSSFVRRIGIHFFSGLISFLTQYKVTDPTSGFRAINKKMINVFAEYYPQDFPEPEAIAVCARYQAKLVEIPVQMRKRNFGNSSIRYLKTLYYMVKVTLAILMDKLKPKKT